MSNILIDNSLEQYKTLIDELFKELYGLTTQLNNPKMADTVDEIRTRLNEPFLFVIVGEVKVGKSSFVNALLQADREICKVAPDPCTDTIQQIVYGEEEKVIPINDYLRKITVPSEILRHIAIVDTPGTNTIITQHTEITERFIPVSDLIIFVFEAKNPYRQSAWQFFDFISKEWRKKVIFVLQQADLIDAEDLEINIKGLTDYAKNRGIESPRIFCVSAKREQRGDQLNSGFAEMRKYIHDNVTGGNVIRLKIQSLLNTSLNITDTIKQGLALREEQMKADTTFRDRIHILLDSAEKKSWKQVEDLDESLINEYDRITDSIQRDFQEGLGFFNLLKKSILSIFDSSEGMKEWTNKITGRIESELRPSLENKIREGLGSLADSIQHMATSIDNEILKSKAGIKSNNQVFTDIANKRQERFEQLHRNFNEWASNANNFVASDLLDQSNSLLPQVQAGGALAVIGAVLAAITHGTALDVTGGILSVVGLTIAGVAAAFSKNKIVRQFADEIAKGRQKLDDQLEDKLKTYVREIKTKIDNNFFEFDTFLAEERRQLDDLTFTYKDIEQKFAKIQKELNI
ncbi:MAG: dynamin family protein [Sphingobacteriales bacterium]|nr:dynamin family protein [Sphingobacteriales bacterium]